MEALTSILRLLTPLLLTLGGGAGAFGPFRAPSIPLRDPRPVVHRLAFGGRASRERGRDTGPARTLGMAGLIRVDGKLWRWMGAEPTTVEAARQTGTTLSALSNTIRLRSARRAFLRRMDDAGHSGGYRPLLPVR
jgi:hypothetical protein